MGRYFGPQKIQDIVTSANSTSIAVSTTSTVYSKSFSLRQFVEIAFGVIATSDGDVNVKLELLMGKQPPATEGSPTTSEFTTIENASALITLTDEILHIDVLSPISMEYGIIKFTGQGTNHTSTILNMFLSAITEN